MRRKKFVPALVLLAVAAAVPGAAQSKKDFRYTVGPGASVSIYNDYGPVTVRAAAGRQVVVTATLASPKVEVEPSQAGNRVEFRSRVQPRAGENDGRVQYDVAVPADSNLSVRVINGAITAENLRGDLSFVDDSGSVTVRNCSGGHVHVQTISGPIVLDGIANGHLEVTSVSGNVALTNVTGRKVTVNTNRGAIKFDGDVGKDSEISLTNNSGDIDFTAPASASMALTARSISGSVQNDFPFPAKPQASPQTSFAAQPGRAFAGTSSTGSSTVELRSFSGTIRVKKR